MNDQTSPEPDERHPDPRASLPSLSPTTTGRNGTSLSAGTLPTDAVVHGDVEPMTLSLLGRLFGVPLVIIGSIVGGAVIVVFAFGAPSAQRDRSLEQLLTSLEAGTGEKSLGMLLPRDKQHWQTGLELIMRLSKKGEFSGAQLQEVAERLGAMIRAELAGLTMKTAQTGTTVAQSSARQQRLGFLIRAIGKTEHPKAIEPLLDVVSRADESFAVLGMAELGNLTHVADTHRSVRAIIERLPTVATPEARIVACTALSVLADRPQRGPAGQLAGAADAAVLETLTMLLRSQEGDVEWSAALALARLGSVAGKSTLLDLLDRSFWESSQRYHTTNDKGTVLRYHMPEERIERNLITAVDAASELSDPDVWNMIERLRDDPRPRVRARAIEVLALRIRTDASLSDETEN